MAKKVKLIQGSTHWAKGIIFHKDVEKEVSDELYGYLKKAYPNRFEFLEDEKEPPKKKVATKRRKTKNDEQEVEKDEENKEESGE